MKHLLLFVLVFFAMAAWGQTVKRQENETAEMFARRLMPDTTELAHAVIETSTWDTTGKAIIAFYGYDNKKDNNTGFSKVLGRLYLSLRENNYRRISFGPIMEDAGYPEILSVFFANADKDKAKELVVLCKYDQRHYDYSGESYQTFIFDDPSGGNELTLLKKLSEQFSGCDCGWRNGKATTAKYKTAKAVKAGLTQMGYKQ